MDWGWKDEVKKEQIQIEVLKHMVDLDEPCWQCVEEYYDCSDYHSSNPQYRIKTLKNEYKNGEHCDRCNNRRFTLTDEGLAIMRLVERHGK